MQNNQHPIEIDDAVMLAQPSKEKAKEIAERIINSCTEGTQNPLDVLVKVRWAQSILNEVAEGILSVCVDEASKYAKGERITKYGAELSMKEAGVKWSFDNCGDPVYADLTEKSGAMKDQIKERETFLKSLKQSLTVADDVTGEIITIAPPMKTSKTIVEVKFK